MAEVGPNTMANSASAGSGSGNGAASAGSGSGTGLGLQKRRRTGNENGAAAASSGRYYVDPSYDGYLPFCPLEDTVRPVENNGRNGGHDGNGGNNGSAGRGRASSAAAAASSASSGARRGLNREDLALLRGPTAAVSPGNGAGPRRSNSSASASSAGRGRGTDGESGAGWGTASRGAMAASASSARKSSPAFRAAQAALSAGMGGPAWGYSTGSKTGVNPNFADLLATLSVPAKEASASNAEMGGPRGSTAGMGYGMGGPGGSSAGWGTASRGAVAASASSAGVPAYKKDGMVYNVSGQLLRFVIPTLDEDLPNYTGSGGRRRTHKRRSHKKRTHRHKRKH